MGETLNEPDTYQILTIPVQTTKMPAKTMLTVYLFTAIYAKNTTWEKIRPGGCGQRLQDGPIQAHLTIERVTDNPDEQQLTVPLVMFHIDAQQLVGKLVQVCSASNGPYRILDDDWW